MTGPQLQGKAYCDNRIVQNCYCGSKNCRRNIMKEVDILTPTCMYIGLSLGRYFINNEIIKTHTIKNFVRR